MPRIPGIALLLLLASSSCALPQESGRPLDLNTSQNLEELQLEKLREEVRALQIENENAGTFRSMLPVYAPFITALVAVIGVFITLWKQLSESNRQKELDRQQREAEQQQRRHEHERRLDEQFNAMATSLGSDQEAIQASAAVSITTFLKKGYEAYYEPVFMLLLANLKLDHSPIICRLLVRAFEKAIRAYIPIHDADTPLDLAHARLSDVDLSGLMLRGADMGFIELKRANLTDADLREVRGYQANAAKARLSQANLQSARLHEANFADSQFHGSTLIDAKLRDANLKGAQFYQAKMQGAHFDGADLTGATFEGADLNNAFFRGTLLNQAALKSIMKAYNWEKAHYDENVRQELTSIAGQ